VRRSTPSFGGFPASWHGATSGAATISVGVMGVTGDVGRLTVKATIVVRGTA
jgi:hypothetical protein